jgi:hypothetical protein
LEARFFKDAKQPHVRRKEATIRALRIRENIRKEYTDKKSGKSYGSGSNDPASKAAARENNASASKEKNGITGEQKKSSCPLCGKFGHKTKRSRHCTFSTFKPKLKNGKFRILRVVLCMYSLFTHTISRY